jgi:hypothetical protein
MVRVYKYYMLVQLALCSALISTIQDEQRHTVYGRCQRVAKRIGSSVKIMRYMLFQDHQAEELLLW